MHEQYVESMTRNARTNRGEPRVLEVIGGAIKMRGQDGFVLSLVEYMNKTGLQVDCLVPYTCTFDSYKERMNGCGVRLFELGISYDPHRTVSEVYWPFLSFLEAHPYDVVHIHSSKTTMMAIMAIAAKKAGVPKVIVHAHNGGHGFSLMHIILRQLGNLCMKSHVDLYCACSRSAAEWKFAKRYAAGDL